MPAPPPADAVDLPARRLALGRSLVGELDAEALLDAILRAAQELTGARFAALGILGPPGHGLARLVTRGVDAATTAAIGDPPEGHGVLGLLIERPESLRLEDLGRHPRSYGLPSGHPPMTSFLAVPVLIDGTPWANVYLTEKAGGPFTAADEESVSSLAEWAAVAQVNARRFAEARSGQELGRRAGERLAASVVIARATVTEPDLSRNLDLIVGRGRDLVTAGTVLIALPVDDDVEIAAGAGDGGSALVGTRLRGDTSEMGDVLRRGGVRHVDTDGLAVTPSDLGIDGVHNALFVPVEFRGARLAVLVALDGDREAPFSGADEELLLDLAALAATAIAADDAARPQGARTATAGHASDAPSGTVAGDGASAAPTGASGLAGGARTTGRRAGTWKAARPSRRAARPARRRRPGRDRGDVDLQRVLDRLPALVGYWDRGLRNRLANATYRHSFGLAPEGLRGMHVRDVLGPDLFASTEPVMRAALAGEEQRLERRVVSPDGRVHHTQASYVPDTVDGRVRGFFVLVIDVTARKEAELALAAAERRSRSLFQEGPLGTLLLDHAGRVLQGNRAAGELFGVAPDELPGRSLAELTDPRDRGVGAAPLEAVTSGRLASCRIERRSLRAGDRSFWSQLDARSLPRGDADDRRAVVVKVQDVGWRLERQAELEAIATHDALTGILNRRGLFDALERAAAHARRYGEVAVVLLVDLDGFKGVNDALGHEVGDAVLREVAALLVRRVRSSDVVARLGGDEFVVLLPHRTHAQATLVAADLVRAVLAARLGVPECPISASVGLARLDGSIPTDDVLGHADRAMYRDKHRVDPAPDAPRTRPDHRPGG